MLGIAYPSILTYLLNQFDNHSSLFSSKFRMVMCQFTGIIIIYWSFLGHENLFEIRLYLPFSDGYRTANGRPFGSKPIGAW